MLGGRVLDRSGSMVAQTPALKSYKRIQLLLSTSQQKHLPCRQQDLCFTTLTLSSRGHLGPHPYHRPRHTNTSILGQQRRAHRLRKQQIHLRPLHRQPSQLKAIHRPHRANNRRPLLAQRLLHRLGRRDRLRARLGQHWRGEHEG
jgi:hypothetical protein